MAGRDSTSSSSSSSFSLEDVLSSVNFSSSVKRDGLGVASDVGRGVNSNNGNGFSHSSEVIFGGGDGWVPPRPSHPRG